MKWKSTTVIGTCSTKTCVTGWEQVLNFIKLVFYVVTTIALLLCFICLEYLLPVVRTGLCSSLLQITDLNGILVGSQGSRHSADSGTTSDSIETKDKVFDETASPFRSSLEMSPPVSPSTPTPPFIQKGAYISKAGMLVFTFLLLQFYIWLWLSVRGFFLNSGNDTRLKRSEEVR